MRWDLSRIPLWIPVWTTDLKNNRMGFKIKESGFFLRWDFPQLVSIDKLSLSKYYFFYLWSISYGSLFKISKFTILGREKGDFLIILICSFSSVWAAAISTVFYLILSVKTRKCHFETFTSALEKNSEKSGGNLKSQTLIDTLEELFLPFNLRFIFS